MEAADLYSVIDSELYSQKHIIDTSRPNNNKNHKHSPAQIKKHLTYANIPEKLTFNYKNK